MENFVQLNKKNTFVLGIKDSSGEYTGEKLVLDFDDIELPLKLNKADIMHKKNINQIRMQIMALQNKQDKKGKYLLSWKEEEEIKLMKEFYEKEMDAFDMVFGKDACKKILAGQDPYYEMFDDIMEALDPYLPKMEECMNSIVDRVKDKYKDFVEVAEENEQ